VTDDELIALPKQQEDELVVRARAGDRIAVELLYRKHRRLIATICYRVCPRRMFRDLGDDLQQEAYLGFSRAIERYDAALGFRFSTYSVWWVRAAVSRVAMRETRRGMTAIKRRTVSAHATADGGVEEADLAAMLGVDVEEVRAAGAAGRPHWEPNQTEDGEAVEFADESAKTEDDIIGHIDATRQQVAVRRYLNSLSERERLIVERRCLSPSCEPLSAIGRELGISRERVRQIEVLAKASLHRIIASKARAT
jgi:RNA polymerase sigma factor (sigma-70 family)